VRFPSQPPSAAAIPQDKRLKNAPNASFMMVLAIAADIFLLVSVPVGFLLPKGGSSRTWTRLFGRSWILTLYGRGSFEVQ
jgi:hypothetical protein